MAVISKMRCIFCNGDSSNSTTNHILPASLGGGQWACLPKGIVCSNCNQYFGDKVERLALESYPFSPFRISLGIPTRKGKAPKVNTHLGTIKGSPFLGIIGIDPISSEVEQGIDSGRITQIRILAEPTKPIAVCRMLVKMGLEVIANDSLDDALSQKFDLARVFARNPVKGTQWWFMVCTDHRKLFSRFTCGITKKDWFNGVNLSVSQFDEFEAFRLQLLDMIIITPLDSRVMCPNKNEFSEPDCRIFSVTT